MFIFRGGLKYFTSQVGANIFLKFWYKKKRWSFLGYLGTIKNVEKMTKTKSLTDCNWQ